MPKSFARKENALPRVSLGEAKRRRNPDDRESLPSKSDLLRVAFYALRSPELTLTPLELHASAAAAEALISRGLLKSYIKYPSVSKCFAVLRCILFMSRSSHFEIFF